jgi:hypothetical protein
MPDLFKNNDYAPPQPQGGGDESFIERQKRLKGQENAQLAGSTAGQGEQSEMPQQKMSDYASGGPSMMKSSGSTTGPAPMATPVSGNGKIPDPAPMQMAQVTSAAQTPAPAAQTPAPRPADIPGVLTWVQTPDGQGWTPQPANGAAPQAAPAAAPGAPAPAPAGAPQPTGLPQRPAGTNLQGIDLGNAAFNAYKGAQFSQATPQGYVAGVTPDGYKADQFSQFKAPDQSALESGNANLAQAILGHPESMSADVVNAMKNSNKEDALLAAKQNEMRFLNAGAARGVSGGGSEGANLRRLYDNTSSDILKANRDIDTTAATTNFNNRLQSMDAVNQLLNSQTGRATSSYGAALSGQSAQSGANQAAAASGLQAAAQREQNAAREADSRLATAGFGREGEKLQADENYRTSESERQAKLDEQARNISQFGINQAVAGNALDNFKTDSGNYFAGRGADLADLSESHSNANANRGMDIQKELGDAGIGVDRARLTEQGRQFDASNALNIMQYLEGKRQSDNSLGFNYASLNANQQQAMMNAILGRL